eukprot:PLAT3302.9.p1 GENE.PLAT3302.9~~PLAT3302.9.p1  ORF type:complete len:480 (-),score=158.23 PLAT3302.9:60-1499(-)
MQRKDSVASSSDSKSEDEAAAAAAAAAAAREAELAKAVKPWKSDIPIRSRRTAKPAVCGGAVLDSTSREWAARNILDDSGDLRPAAVAALKRVFARFDHRKEGSLTMAQAREFTRFFKRPRRPATAGSRRSASDKLVPGAELPLASFLDYCVLLSQQHPKLLRHVLTTSGFSLSLATRSRRSAAAAASSFSSSISSSRPVSAASAATAAGKRNKKWRPEPPVWAVPPLTGKLDIMTWINYPAGEAALPQRVLSTARRRQLVFHSSTSRLQMDERRAAAERSSTASPSSTRRRGRRRRRPASGRPRRSRRKQPLSPSSSPSSSSSRSRRRAERPASAPAHRSFAKRLSPISVSSGMPGSSELLPADHLLPPAAISGEDRTTLPPPLRLYSGEDLADGGRLLDSIDAVPGYEGDEVTDTDSASLFTDDGSLNLSMLLAPLDSQSRHADATPRGLGRCIWCGFMKTTDSYHSPSYCSRDPAF